MFTSKREVSTKFEWNFCPQCKSKLKVKAMLAFGLHQNFCLYECQKCYHSMVSYTGPHVSKQRINLKFLSNC